MSSLSAAGMGLGVHAAGQFASSVWKIKLTPTSEGQWSANRPFVLKIRGASSNSRVVEFETGKDERARFAGDDPLAKLVNRIISVKPIYNLLKLGAKNLMTAGLLKRMV
ncbi:hypothetical protein R1sor_017954 [Riccia sorocarpa]|uniref:Uncharacterized protein n=1 Tax=Riccia sorocarpa TaxID=122646 RepID=A0ABD3I8G2_9MARC